MPKKTIKKSTSKDANKALIESNMLLQSKIADLVQSDNELIKEIKSMIKFFCEAGERMVIESEEERLKPLFERLNALLDQNKTIIRGLLLVQKYIKSATPEETPAKPISPTDIEF